MKATAHWLELKGHTEKKPSTMFDESFSDQVFATGKIEDGLVLTQVLRAHRAAAVPGLAGRAGARPRLAAAGRRC